MTTQWWTLCKGPCKRENLFLSKKCSRKCSGSSSWKWFLESNKVPEWFQIHFAYLPNLSLFACWKKHFGKQFSRSNVSWFAKGLLEVNFNVLHWHDEIQKVSWFDNRLSFSMHWKFRQHLSMDWVKLKTPSLSSYKNFVLLPGFNLQKKLLILNLDEAKELSPLGVIVFSKTGLFHQLTGNISAYVT